MTRAPRRDIHSLDTQITAPHPTSSPSETQLTRRDRYAAPPPAESIASDHSQHPRQHRNPNPQRPRSPPTDPPTPPISRQDSFHDETGGQETAQIPPYPQHDSPVYDYSEHERSVDFNPPSSPASPKEVVIQERRAGNQGYDEYTAVETSKHTRNGTITQITYTKGPREGHVEYLDSKFRLTDCDGNVIVSEESYNGNRGYVDEERNRDPQYADEVPSMEPRAGFFEVEERFPPATQDDNGLRPRQESSVHPLKARHRHETGSVRSEHETRSGNYGRATRRNPYTQENQGTEYDAPVALDTYPSRVANDLARSIRSPRKPDYGLPRSYRRDESPAHSVSSLDWESDHSRHAKLPVDNRRTRDTKDYESRDVSGALQREDRTHLQQASKSEDRPRSPPRERTTYQPEKSRDRSSSPPKKDFRRRDDRDDRARSRSLSSSSDSEFESSTPGRATPPVDLFLTMSLTSKRQNRNSRASRDSRDYRGPKPYGQTLSIPGLSRRQEAAETMRLVTALRSAADTLEREGLDGQTNMKYMDLRDRR